MKAKHTKSKSKFSEELENSKAAMLDELNKLKCTGPLLSQDGQAAVDRLTELVKALPCDSH